eukprot:403349859
MKVDKTDNQILSIPSNSVTLQFNKTKHQQIGLSKSMADEPMLDTQLLSTIQSVIAMRKYKKLATTNFSKQNDKMLHEGQITINTEKASNQRGELVENDFKKAIRRLSVGVNKQDNLLQLVSHLINKSRDKSSDANTNSAITTFLKNIGNRVEIDKILMQQKNGSIDSKQSGKLYQILLGSNYQEILNADKNNEPVSQRKQQQQQSVFYKLKTKLEDIEKKSEQYELLLQKKQAAQNDHKHEISFFHQQQKDHTKQLNLKNQTSNNSSDFYSSYQSNQQQTQPHKRQVLSRRDSVTLRNLDQERKELMSQLKQNFKFIEGFNNKHPVRDEKGLLKNKEWRVESNIQKKIIKPTQKVSHCLEDVDKLWNENINFSNYLLYFKKDQDSSRKDTDSESSFDQQIGKQSIKSNQRYNLQENTDDTKKTTIRKMIGKRLNQTVQNSPQFATPQNNHDITKYSSKQNHSYNLSQGYKTTKHAKDNLTINLNEQQSKSPIQKHSQQFKVNEQAFQDMLLPSLQFNIKNLLTSKNQERLIEQLENESTRKLEKTGRIRELQEKLNGSVNFDNQVQKILSNSLNLRKITQEKSTKKRKKQLSFQASTFKSSRQKNIENNELILEVSINWEQPKHKRILKSVLNFKQQTLKEKKKCNKNKKTIQNENVSLSYPYTQSKNYLINKESFNQLIEKDLSSSFAKQDFSMKNLDRITRDTEIGRLRSIGSGINNHSSQNNQTIIVGDIQSYGLDNVKFNANMINRLKLRSSLTNRQSNSKLIS